MTTDLKALVGGLYDLLEPVESAERHKAIKAVMAMLGDQPVSLGKVGGKDDDAGDEDGGDGDSEYPRKARDWMKRYIVSEDNLGQVFHIENGQAEVIAHEVPGSTTKQKTINAYVLTGIAQLLATGDTKFDDKTARNLCKKMGFFSEGNHATYMKEKGNVLGGTKDAGWTLTTPGLKSGAEIVKGLAHA